jgi:nucleoside phosphorylase
MTKVCRRRDGADSNRAYIQIGNVASANETIRSGEHRNQIVIKEKVIGLEIEGAGVWDNISCIIIKGVSDYADSHKSKAWLAYASATSASATKTFLEYWRPISKEGEYNYRKLKCIVLC